MRKTKEQLKWLDAWTDDLAALDRANPWFSQTVEPEEPVGARRRPDPTRLRRDPPIGKPFKT